MLALPLAAWGTIAATIATLVILEGLLSADNALVLAVMVRHLPKEEQKRALRYGIFGAFFFRAVAILLATQILDYWQFEVVGGLYLLYLALAHLLSRDVHGPDKDAAQAVRASRFRGFWGTVVGVELADIAFSIDSILAAVAMAEGLPAHIKSVDFGWIDLKDTIVYIGGILGIITMRFVAGRFLVLLERFPGLARGAYYLVGWIGLKLIGSGLHHALFREGQRIKGGWRDRIPPLPEWFEHLLEMPSLLFWGGMLTILALSLIFGRNKATPGAAPSVPPDEA